MNALIGERDTFAARWPERAEAVRGRIWGVTELPGDGPALLILPGTLGRGDVFWRVMDRLAGRARMIAVTYPASHDLAAWGEDLMRLLDRRGIDRAHVLGSSLGGYLAQWIAGTHADRCAGLIAANTLHGVDFIQSVPPYAGDLARTPIAALRAGFAAGLGRWAETHPADGDMIGLLLAEVSGRIPARHLRARLMALKTAPALPAPGIPADRIAVIEAEDDPLIPPQVREAVRARLAPAVTCRFESGGHFPYIPQADLYAAAVAERIGIARAPSPWGTGALRRR
jgi:maspardin